MQLWEATCSARDCLVDHECAFIPLHEISDPALMKRYGVKPDAKTLDIVNAAAEQKVEVLLKIYWGDASEKLCEAIDKIPLSCIVIGNRCLGKIKRAIMGSLSDHVIKYGMCPITVVKSTEAYQVYKKYI